MILCPGSLSPWELADPCIRESWAAIIPAALVLLLCVSQLPISFPPSVRNVLGTDTFRTFLTLHEAEALECTSKDAFAVEIDIAPKSRPLLCFISLLQSFAWLALALYRLATQPVHPSPLLPGVLALPWIYVSLCLLLRPSSAPPYDLFVLLLAHLAMGVLMLGGALYTHCVLNEPSPGSPILAGLFVNVVGVLVGLEAIMSIPMDVPSTRSRVKKADIVSFISGTDPVLHVYSSAEQGRSASPENYATLFKWTTFAWVHPLIQLASHLLCSSCAT